MKRIKTIETRDLKKSVKTSCGVANQQCEKCMSEK